MNESKCIMLSKRSKSERGYILCNFNYKTFWKRQNKVRLKDQWQPEFGGNEERAEQVKGEDDLWGSKTILYANCGYMTQFVKTPQNFQKQFREKKLQIKRKEQIKRNLIN